MFIQYRWSLKPVQIYTKHKTPKYCFLWLVRTLRYAPGKTPHKKDGFCLSCKGAKMLALQTKTANELRIAEWHKAGWAKKNTQFWIIFLGMQIWKFFIIHMKLSQRRKIKSETENKFNLIELVDNYRKTTSLDLCIRQVSAWTLRREVLSFKLLEETRKNSKTVDISKRLFWQTCSTKAFKKTKQQWVKRQSKTHFCKYFYLYITNIHAQQELFPTPRTYQKIGSPTL